MIGRRALASGLLVLAATGCDAAVDSTPPVADRGDPGRGQQLVRDRGCTSCHRIPDVPGHDAFVGPPLDAWSRRSFIAGELPNSAVNLRRWLDDPQAVRPGSAMPDVRLTEGEIDDIVAFLFSID